ncbi:MAG TPA: RNA polymerase sigma factor [Bacteroidota bacterium]|nr:RNA polymerase sigma factor [Bacteroidota bacterium]
MEQELTPVRSSADSFDLVQAAHRERPRLLAFVKRHVRNSDDAEDILQDVFSRLVDASNLVEPIEQVTAWLFRVTRNRIVDWYRGRKATTSMDAGSPDRPAVEELVADPYQDPATQLMSSMILDQVDSALEELPEEQRFVFVAHELEGRSFKEIEAETGVPLNTLLSRKRYAVLFLRERLQELYDEFTDE